jgi:hypothetical protein
MNGDVQASGMEVKVYFFGCGIAEEYLIWKGTAEHVGEEAGGFGLRANVGGDRWT